MITREKKMTASVKAEGEVETPFFLGKIERADGRVTYMDFVTHGEARRLGAGDKTVTKIWKYISNGVEVVIFERE